MLFSISLSKLHFDSKRAETRQFSILTEKNEFFVHRRISEVLNAPISNFENKKSARFWMQKEGFELLTAPKCGIMLLARLKLQKRKQWACSFSNLTSELFYDL